MPFCIWHERSKGVDNRATCYISQQKTGNALVALSRLAGLKRLTSSGELSSRSSPPSSSSGRGSTTSELGYPVVDPLIQTQQSLPSQTSPSRPVSSLFHRTKSTGVPIDTDLTSDSVVANDIAGETESTREPTKSKSTFVERVSSGNDVKADDAARPLELAENQLAFNGSTDFNSAEIVETRKTDITSVDTLLSEETARTKSDELTLNSEAIDSNNRICVVDSLNDKSLDSADLGLRISHTEVSRDDPVTDRLVTETVLDRNTVAKDDIARVTVKDDRTSKTEIPEDEVIIRHRAQAKPTTTPKSGLTKSAFIASEKLKRVSDEKTNTDGMTLSVTSERQRESMALEGKSYVVCT